MDISSNGINVILVNQSLSIKNSNINITDTTINVQGCISLSNSTISVDVSTYKLADHEKVLIDSKDDCLDGNASVTFKNVPKCFNAEGKTNTSSLFVVFKKDVSCYA